MNKTLAMKNLKKERPIASRTQNQVEQPMLSRTRRQMDVESFPDIKYENNIQEWLEDTTFVAFTMCDPNEPQTFQQTWWNPDKMQEKNVMKQSD